MLPEAAEAIRLAEKHLKGASIERRKALSLDIQEAIMRHARAIATDAIDTAIANVKQRKQAS